MQLKVRDTMLLLLKVSCMVRMPGELCANLQCSRVETCLEEECQLSISLPDAAIQASR